MSNNPRNYPSPAYVSSRLDDAGLTAKQFRVMAHVCRRCSTDPGGRGCDRSIDDMARVCCVCPETVRRALKKLVSLGWLTATPREGMTTVYHVRFPEAPPLTQAPAPNATLSSKATPALHFGDGPSSNALPFEASPPPPLKHHPTPPFWSQPKGTRKGTQQGKFITNTLDR